MGRKSARNEEVALILVDTSVWIEYLSEKKGIYGSELERLLASEAEIAIADIIVMEVLQGIRNDRTHQDIKELLLVFPVFSSTGLESCIKAAALYRNCRKRGVTIRKSIDCLLAITAMENDLRLFQKDRDFEVIAKIAPLKLYQFSKTKS